jgi:HEPN domain-containing protein
VQAPSSSRDFLKAAGQRLTTAQFLLANSGYTLDAMYIGGYALECALKALILEKTPPAEKSDRLTRITSGAVMHRYDVLAGMLKDMGTVFPSDLARRLRKSNWSPELRYQTGRLDPGETRAFLKTVEAIYQWVKGELK